MTRDEYKELLVELKVKRERMLDGYRAIIKKHKPELLLDPFERYKLGGGDFGLDKGSDVSDEVWKEGFEKYKSSSNSKFLEEKNHYLTGYSDPQDGSFYDRFSYDDLWGDMVQRQN